SPRVDERVVANWRLYRIWAGEAAMFDNKMQALLPNPEPRTQRTGRGGGHNEDEKPGDAASRCARVSEENPERLFGQAFEELAGNENALKLMMRYEANCRWQYDRAL